MDARPDDFAALLAALGKAPAPVQTNPVPYYQQFAPQPYYPPQFPPPQSYAPPKPASKFSWVVIILILAIVAFGLLAWMRSARMEEPEDRALAREIPPPSAVSSMYEPWPEPEEVANKLLKFVEKHAPEPEKPKDVIDLSGVDLPDERVVRTTGRISADDSQAVTDYAKKREALFE
jgi:hypothetical protein